MRLGGFPSLVSSKHVFNISSQSDMEIRSYWPSNAGTEFGD